MSTPPDGPPVVPTPADLAAQAAAKAAAAKPAETVEGDTFPRAYVEDLRAENKRRREEQARASEQLAELLAWKTEQEQALLSDEDRWTAEFQATQQARDDAEARAAEFQLQYEVACRATALGIRDPSDAVRLLNWDSLEFSETGDVTNMDSVLEDLVKAKPYLKGAVEAITVLGDTPAGGNPSGDRGGSAPLTIEAIKLMGPDEINARWAEIEPVLAAQKR